MANIRNNKFFRLSKDLYRYKDSNGEWHILDKKVDDHSKNIINLIDCLDSVESGTDVIITIGSGGGDEKSFQTNMKLSDSNRTLILNIDTSFENTVDTASRRFFVIKFDNTLVEIIDPVINKILVDPHNNVVICDFRQPKVFEDCATLICKHIDHLREPNSTQGNLLFLQGYFHSFPMFWPTKKNISEEMQLAMKTKEAYSGIYSKIYHYLAGYEIAASDEYKEMAVSFNSWRKSPERKEPGFTGPFKDNAVIDCHGNGYCFLYENFSSLSEIQSVIFSKIKGMHLR